MLQEVYANARLNAIPPNDLNGVELFSKYFPEKYLSCAALSRSYLHGM